MALMAFAALVLGVVLGLRYNAWALLLWLCTAVLAMASTLLVLGNSLSSTALSTVLVLASIEIGYLGGAYAAQIGLVRRAPRSAPFVINH
jgi:hypothetical protein